MSISMLPSSNRRPSPLRPADYDHEIRLVDDTKARAGSRGSSSASRTSSASPSRRDSTAPLRHSFSLRKEITKIKYSKYQERPEQSSVQEQSSNSVPGAEAENGRGRVRGITPPDIHKEPESAIDILYENQRGGFLCGLLLFSSKALGALDAPPWTNEAQKPSATNITNAQVPDPSWKWAWEEWSINHQENVDDDGWEYSFAFGKPFSWHSAAWWNSFVRRRAWIRKRVRQNSEFRVQQPHLLNADYFTIHPAHNRSESRTSNSREATAAGKMSSETIDYSQDEAIQDICDVGTLMKVLRSARIDREKMEAVVNFIEHGGDELYYLRERMHDIMHTFIFQASRRLLLSHLLELFSKANSEREKAAESDTKLDPADQKRLENLEAAFERAEEEVKRLEFWSDIKKVAESGVTGAQDASQGWSDKWRGLDNSGPKDVLSERKLPGKDDCEKENGTSVELNIQSGRKGKAKR